MARPSKYPLNPAQIAAVSSLADVSARSVRRYLGGASMHGSTLRRVGAALRAAGLEAHVRPIPAAPPIPAPGQSAAA